MKYPYIGKANLDDSLVLFYSEGCGMCFRSDNWSGGLRVDYNERAFKNITHEYLANTYGEVQSPEHAEFIIELCESNGLELARQSKRLGNFFSFYVNKFCFLNVDSIVSQHCKKITIPLPPKADKQESSEWPQVGDEVFYKESGNSKGVVLAIDADIAWIKNSYGGYSIIDIKSLVKPKTPEEELRDDILDCDNFAITEAKANQLANWLTNKGYEIKKKPQ